MHTLGINAAYHDCSAAIVCDGVVLAAAEEERFTRIKHGKRPVPFSTWQLPFNAIDYCLQQAGLMLTDLDHVAYSFDPTLLPGMQADDATITLPLQPSARNAPRATGGAVAGDPSAASWLSPWDPLFLSSVVNAPRQLAAGAPHHLQARFHGARHDGPYAWHFIEHHLAHEASAFLAAPFDSCAVLTMDGRGEQATTSYGLYRDNAYGRIRQVNLPHSLGLLYESVTAYLGFLHSSDEYKVMALASYGKPAHAAAFREILSYQGGGDYRITAVDFCQLFGPARQRGGPITAQHQDIARSLQLVLQETVLQMTSWLQRESGERNLALAGGVALNCVLNATLVRAGRFDRIWVQPAAGDAGTALGAALWVDACERARAGETPRRPHSAAPAPVRLAPRRWRMEHAYLGPQFDDDAIETLLRQSGLRYRRIDDIAQAAADLLAQNRIVGWFQGRMEFGPRALGARSILASPIDAAMQERLNHLKDREDFRPVAPAVREEAAADWFVDCRDAPFMVFVFDVVEERAGQIAAARHVDGTARVQTVNRDQNRLYYDLLCAFEERTGVPVLINTSFNTRGLPIVCTPRDALESYCTTPLDALVIGSFLLEKAGGCWTPAAGPPTAMTAVPATAPAPACRWRACGASSCCAR